MRMSFATGEISPLLHARVDLARYTTGLAELKNMIVLPQGGVTRRGGFSHIGSSVSRLSNGNYARLIPFEFNRTDAELLEFGDKVIRVWQQSSGSYSVACTVTSPYALADVRDLRYAQSGNIIFLAHRNYKPQMLTRNSLTSWTIQDLPFSGGPWIDGSEWSANATLRFLNKGTTRKVESEWENIFVSGLAGSLLKVEYAVNAQTYTLTSSNSDNGEATNPFEVKGTLNVVTAGEWRGTITVERSADGGSSWVAVRQYVRTDTEKQGQWDFTISETEDGIYYRVRAYHGELRTADVKASSFNAVVENDYLRKRTTQLPITTTLNVSGSTNGQIGAANYDGDVTGSVNSSITFSPSSVSNTYEYEEGDINTAYTKLNIVQSSSIDDTPATVTISASGFLKKEIYKIDSIINSYTAVVTRQTKKPFSAQELSPNSEITLWSMGAWGEIQGYPSAVCMYQDRLIFAGSKRQPQTIWFSRTGDYADFSTSDPLSDDDAVTITLAGSGADGIHSLISAGDLLAFTNGGEWKIRGEGSSGAITPTALTAHQQTNIGTKNIQPILANGKIIFVQSLGRKVYALGYDLNTDGYAGSELTILSSHIFEGKTIIDMAYQREPDSILWFVLSDGTLAACTYNPEHEVIGWSRHETQWKALSVCALDGESETEMFFCVHQTGTIIRLERLRSRVNETDFTDDNAYQYPSIIRTLRLNTDGENGNMYTNKKLIARVRISALKSTLAWVAPGEKQNEAANWERRRKVLWDYADYINDADVQMDNGFSEYACIQIRNEYAKSLTIAAITPIITAGG